MGGPRPFRPSQGNTQNQTRLLLLQINTKNRVIQRAPLKTASLGCAAPSPRSYRHQPPSSTPPPALETPLPPRLHPTSFPLVSLLQDLRRKKSFPQARNQPISCRMAKLRCADAGKTSVCFETPGAAAPAPCAAGSGSLQACCSGGCCRSTHLGFQTLLQPAEPRRRLSGFLSSFVLVRCEMLSSQSCCLPALRGTQGHLASV